MRNSFIIVLLFFIVLNVNAQNNTNITDTSTVAHFLKKGTFKGFSRSYFMSTINDGALKDFYNFGSSIGAHYETKKWKGLQFGATATFIFNLAGTDLTQRDTITNKPSRYEIGMFDVTDPARRWDLGKLEEVYLKYNINNSSIKIGRQLLNTPFINPQNGRIRPTFEEGAWLDIKELKHFQFQLGYLWRMAPRSTIQWYNVGESIGLYPVGRNVDGSPSGYKGQTNTPGILMANATFKRRNKEQKCDLHIQWWEQMLINVYNTTLLQVDWSKYLNDKGLKLDLGVQGVNQLPLGNGGNDLDSMRYYSPDQQTWILGGRAGLKNKRSSLHLNYTRIFGTGRFLMPREWGREPLYTCIPRERNEGAGNVHAFTTNISHKLPKAGLRAQLFAGVHLLPDPREAALNKYAMPSYSHILLMLDKTFKGTFEGLHFKVIYMYKMPLTDTFENPNFIYNKVNMHHIDVMMNYNF